MLILSNFCFLLVIWQCSSDCLPPYCSTDFQTTASTYSMEPTSTSQQGTVSYQSYAVDYMSGHCSKFWKALAEDICGSQYFSFNGRCGGASTKGRPHCSCDSLCRIYKDSCWDYESLCPGEHLEYLKYWKQFPDTELVCIDGMAVINRCGNITEHSISNQTDYRENLVAVDWKLHFRNQRVLEKCFGNSQLYDTWMKFVEIRENATLQSLENYLSAGRNDDGLLIYDIPQRFFKVRYCAMNTNMLCLMNPLWKQCNFTDGIIVVTTEDLCGVSKTNGSQVSHPSNNNNNNNDNNNNNYNYNSNNDDDYIKYANNNKIRTKVSLDNQLFISQNESIPGNETNTQTQNLNGACIRLSTKVGANYITREYHGYPYMKLSLLFVVPGSPQFNIITSRGYGMPQGLECQTRKAGDACRLKLECDLYHIPVRMACRKPTFLVAEILGKRQYAALKRIVFDLFSFLLRNTSYFGFSPISTWVPKRKIRQNAEYMTMKESLPFEIYRGVYDGTRLFNNDVLERLNLNKQVLSLWKQITLCFAFKKKRDNKQWLLCDRLQTNALTVNFDEHFVIEASEFPDQLLTTQSSSTLAISNQGETITLTLQVWLLSFIGHFFRCWRWELN